MHTCIHRGSRIQRESRFVSSIAVLLLLGGCVIYTDSAEVAGTKQRLIVGQQGSSGRIWVQDATGTHSVTVTRAR
jgi:hypothetical protein